MIVVDTNVIAYLFLSSALSASSERALVKDSEWAAPLLWRSEFRNLLARYMRNGYLALEPAQRIMASALEVLGGREYEVPSHAVLRLASESRCAAYDCEFVAVAKDLNVPLVTVDKALLREFPEVAIALAKYGE